MLSCRPAPVYATDCTPVASTQTVPALSVPIQSVHTRHAATQPAVTLDMPVDAPPMPMHTITACTPTAPRPAMSMTDCTPAVPQLTWPVHEHTPRPTGPGPVDYTPTVSATSGVIVHALSQPSPTLSEAKPHLTTSSLVHPSAPPAPAVTQP